MPKGTPRITSKWTPRERSKLSAVERQEIERRVEDLFVLDMQWGLTRVERSILEGIRRSLDRYGTISVPQHESLNRMVRRPRGPDFD
jgi:hypothetical protein